MPVKMTTKQQCRHSGPTARIWRYACLAPEICISRFSFTACLAPCISHHTTNQEHAFMEKVVDLQTADSGIDMTGSLSNPLEWHGLHRRLALV